ncbi:response regulator [bacterium]|nr:response regulator [bacterium]
MTLHALIIDDSEINQLLIQKVLDSVGVTHDVAFSGHEAIAKVKSTAFDMIFMDIQMPDMDGYETTYHIRASDNGQDVPIVAVTANAREEDEAQAKAAGMDAFLTKPVYPDQIIDLIHKYTSKKSTIPGMVEPPSGSQKFDAFFDKINRDVSFLQKMADRFDRNAQDLLGQIREAHAASTGQLAHHVHTLKGIVAAFEVDRPYQAVLKLEEAIRAESTTDYPVLIDQVENEINQMRQELQEFIAIKRKG